MVGLSEEASAWVLDFSSFPHGAVIHDQFSTQIPGAPTGLGVTIYADNFNIGDTQTSNPSAEPPENPMPNIGNLVSTGSGPRDLVVAYDPSLGDTNGGDPDLNQPFEDGFVFTEGEKLLIIQDDENAAGCTDTCSPPDDEGTSSPSAGQFIFDFTRETIILSIDIFDIESGEATPSDTEILMYDVAGNLLNTVTPRLELPVTGDNGHQRVDVLIGKVKTLVIEMHGSGAISLIGGDDPVGGQIISNDSIPLLIAGTESNSYSALTLFVIAGGAVFGALYYTSRRKLDLQV